VKAEKLKSKRKLTYQVMKKIIILIPVLFYFSLSVTKAQIGKGKIMIGVSTSFSYINYGSDLMSLGFTSIKQKSNAPVYVEPPAQKWTTFNFLPKAGYFVTDNLALGLDVCIASSVQKDDQSDSEYRHTNLGVGPFVRYYLAGTKVMPFFEVASLFGSITEKDRYQNNSNTYKTGVTSIGGGVGIAVKLADKLTFDMMAGYNSTRSKDKTNNPDDNRTVQGTIGFKFGFVVLLGSK
jgi:outer membrane protein